ncbi:hypothetical protein JYU34_013150 [Plutella xylostella]|uniref:Uncharacterized protein n=1 Tax=Plutella xylostella TaxID=51655 RepID=A0ABQ7QD35_PLUXY|nr:hypothetical protein JYU34_013150 [Plutella xylostella]
MFKVYKRGHKIGDRFKRTDQKEDLSIPPEAPPPRAEARSPGFEEDHHRYDLSYANWVYRSDTAAQQSSNSSPSSSRSQKRPNYHVSRRAKQASRHSSSCLKPSPARGEERAARRRRRPEYFGRSSATCRPIKAKYLALSYPFTL